MNLEIVLQRLPDQLQERILNLYQIGSRVYGTATEDSDWDFVAVVNGNYTGETILDMGNVTVNTYDVAAFERLLTDHLTQAIMCIYLPKEHIWKNERNFDNFVLNKKILRKSFMRKICSCFNRAKIYCSEAQYYHMKKMITHTFRYLSFAQQIQEQDRIVDYTCANSLWFEIKENPREDWKSYEDYYRFLLVHSTFC